MGWRIALLALLLVCPETPRATNAVDVAPAARSLQPGELLVLTLTTPAGADRVKVGAFGREIPVIPVGERTWRALVGIDLAVAPGSYPVSIDVSSSGDSTSTNYPLDVISAEFATRELRVANAFVHPPAATRRRIAREAARLRQVWKASASEPLWSGAFVPPVPGEVVSSFGQRSLFNGEPRGVHSGTDFRGVTGTPVQAPNAGRVVLAQDLYYSGNTVVIDHGLGFFSLFAHLSAFAVREGEAVSTSQMIGRVGATGRVTGPHLHWAVRVNGARIDPLSVLAVLGS